MTHDEWVNAIREEIAKRIKEYDATPSFLKQNGFARLVLSDSIAELAAANAHLLLGSES